MTSGTNSNDANMDGATVTYAELLNTFEPRPISTDEQYWKTQEIIELLLSEPELSEDAQLYLHLLAMMMEAYDEQKDTIPELQ